MYRGLPSLDRHAFAVAASTLFLVCCTGVVTGDLPGRGAATAERGGSGGAAPPGSSSGGAGSDGTSSATGGSTAGIGGASSSAGGGSGSGTSTVTDPNGLPCDVQTLLATRCQACHQANPPGLLLSHADLTAASLGNPAESVARSALRRMSATDRTHMPPAPLPAVPSDELAAFAAWVEAGTPEGSCGSPAAPGANPYDTPTVCTSGTSWTQSDGEGEEMRPGEACIDCHSDEDDAPTFAVAGTLYPTPHEPDRCHGAPGSNGAVVVITDATGAEHRLTPNAVGTFFIEAAGIPTPYQARIEYQGRQRVMIEAQTSGDCNGCHTERGDDGAPGRIFLP